MEINDVVMVCWCNVAFIIFKSSSFYIVARRVVVIFR